MEKPRFTIYSNAGYWWICDNLTAEAVTNANGARLFYHIKSDWSGTAQTRAQRKADKLNGVILAKAQQQKTRERQKEQSAFKTQLVNEWFALHLLPLNKKSDRIRGRMGYIVRTVKRMKCSTSNP